MRDVIKGDFGSDRIQGGPNSDAIGGEEGSDTLGGGGGDDVLVAETGVDRIDAGTGNDILVDGALLLIAAPVTPEDEALGLFWLPTDLRDLGARFFPGETEFFEI